MVLPAVLARAPARGLQVGDAFGFSHVACAASTSCERSRCMRFMVSVVDLVSGVGARWPGLLPLVTTVPSVD